jgi:hypothetical protein
MRTLYAVKLGVSTLLYTKEEFLEEIPTFLEVDKIKFSVEQIQMSEEEYARIPKIDLRPNAQHTIR